LEVPQYFPLSRLKLPVGEDALWWGYNPTFHRFLDYGLVLSSRALYLCRRAWWLFAYWSRVPLDEIVAVTMIKGRARPGLRIDTTHGSIKFYTPYDFYRDDMVFDAGVLEKAIAAIHAARPELEPAGDP
jgi:hypothetical protein